MCIHSFLTFIHKRSLCDTTNTLVSASFLSLPICSAPGVQAPTVMSQPLPSCLLYLQYIYNRDLLGQAIKQDVCGSPSLWSCHLSQFYNHFNVLTFYSPLISHRIRKFYSPHRRFKLISQKYVKIWETGFEQQRYKLTNGQLSSGFPGFGASVLESVSVWHCLFSI